MLSQQKNKPPIKLIPNIGNITQKSYGTLDSKESKLPYINHVGQYGQYEQYGQYSQYGQYGEYGQYNQQYDRSGFITIDQIHTPITSKDVLLRNIHIIDDIKPVLCERMYNILFCHDDNDDNDDNDNKIRESFINSRVNEIIDYSTYFKENVKVLKLEKLIRILKISSFFNKYCELFLNDDNIYKSIIDKTTDINTKYDISDKNNINTIISISKQDFLELSLETYPDDTAIIRQFIVDLPRQDVFINGVQIKDIDHMLFLLGRFNREVKINTKNRPSINTTILSVALVCQSSFFMSFVHLLDKCKKMHMMSSQSISDSVVTIIPTISELTMTSQSVTNNQKLNMHVFDVKERDVISFNITHDTYKCSFAAKYRIVDITTDTTFYNINTEILIDLDNDIGLIVYNVV